MGGHRHFRYALEPLLLTRQWELDRLRTELGELNAAWATQHQAVQALLSRQQESVAQWNGLGASGQPLYVDRFVMLQRYIDDGERQLRQAREALDALAERRDALTDTLRLAQRALEAVQEHRQKMQAQFMQSTLSLDFKAADDQWIMAQGNRNHDDHAA